MIFGSNAYSSCTYGGRAQSPSVNVSISAGNISSSEISLTIKNDFVINLGVLSALLQTISPQTIIDINVYLNTLNILSYYLSPSLRLDIKFLLSILTLDGNILNPSIVGDNQLMLTILQLIGNIISPSTNTDYKLILNNLNVVSNYLNLSVSAGAQYIIKISKNNKLYRVLLVSLTDPNASKIRVFDGNSIKALRKI